ncbi:MAG: DUF268 domain-containing protein [Phycisphaeraceae bacterium]|nr:DUF268 domain-containing protein [Phycisphaeraceae bacterium]
MLLIGMRQLGFDVPRFLGTVARLPGYLRQRRRFARLQAQSKLPIALGKVNPQLYDATAQSGHIRGHYFHQDLLVARRIHQSGPRRHLDVGSRIDGFVAHVAAFRPIQVIDIRPLESKVPNITFLQADMMAPLPEQLRACCDSLSCLHTLEHFGLGRYGDPLIADGYLMGLENLHTMLESRGRLYLSVPIGPLRVEFNAHRVFSIEFLLELFRDRFDIDRFSYVDDAGDLHEDVSWDDAAAGNNFGCRYGCGIFELIRAD